MSVDECGRINSDIYVRIIDEWSFFRKTIAYSSLICGYCMFIEFFQI